MLKNNNSVSSAFDWFLMDIMPLVEKYAIQPKYGYHGLYTHTAAVVFRGIDCAVFMNKPVKPVVLACAFHDMARTNDGVDTEHGTNAIPMARNVMKEIENIDLQIQESIIYAVKNHSFNLTAPDYISACLWDADRVRLAWECGYYPQYFATNRAKTVASESAKKYLKFMQNNMSEYAKKLVQHIDEQY